MSKVEIKSSCVVRIASNATTPPLMSRLELTPWDLRFLPFHYIQSGLLFHKPQSHDHNFIDSLKISLSRTLHFFPPLAGRLATVQNNDNTRCFFVDCNNAGAEFVHAVGDVSVSDIMEPKCVPDELVSSLFQLNGVLNLENSMPLLSVQVTELVDGLFVGCAANHSVVDGASFWHFFNSWSEICRGLETISKSPVFERSFPTMPLPPLQKKIASPNFNVKRVFQFSKESLAKLKDKANSEAATNKISSLQALSAHLWLSYTRCRGDADDQVRSNREARFVMIIGARGRIPLPEGYFGNAAFTGVATVEKTELLQKGLGYAAMKINDVVAQQTKERAIKDIEEKMRNPVPLANRVSSTAFVITGSPRHDVYGNDFGWGRPIAVRGGVAPNSDGLMITYPTAAAGGVEVQACLTPETCRKMENDAEFMEAFLS